MPVKGSQAPSALDKVDQLLQAAVQHRTAREDTLVEALSITPIGVRNQIPTVTSVVAQQRKHGQVALCDPGRSI
ncbi:hypothetical protein K466DRAFT_55612 [Polyporus arcularius HHB13444]|uniref:Uncharacterized protein n=1 Tax=Polyporus arcularius HHB13444 TaxID=1314778 RepID=A0A5C3NZA9_9APHY|nr:hypothetical protein K466DRAFT_55612 [Polyporus arcularius HHB13444]